MAGDGLFDVSEDLDDEIEAFVARYPQLTRDRVVRDIARIHTLLHLVEEGMLGETAVLTGGMAMRCYNSNRFSVYDTDTSSALAVSDRDLLELLNYEDEHVRVSLATIRPEDHGKDLVDAHPVEFEAFFTGLEIEDPTFKVTVSNRGLERSAEWLPIVTRYPFQLWDPGKKYVLPVMNRNELLAEKIVAWWMFAPAKHYADISHLGALLYADRLVHDAATKADLRELVEKKLAVNSKVSRAHRSKVERLDTKARKARLLEPERFLDREHGFDKLAFVSTKPPRADRMKERVRRWVAPLLFDV
jgi:predicted nucleotidyltransferase component of viral defense system